MKKQPIKWTPKEVLTKDIKPTPKNYKIKTELGEERLSMSMKLFGNASTVIVNTDYHLIDGNSRLEEEKKKGTKKMWVMWPSRKLTPAEYKEFSAMFDFAKAGEIDMDSIEGDLGNAKEFYTRWGMEVPIALLGEMGKQKSRKAKEFIEEEQPKKDGKVKSTQIPGAMRMVQLFFNEKQEKEFRVIETKLMKRYKTDSTTDTVLKALKSIK